MSKRGATIGFVVFGLKTGVITAISNEIKIHDIYEKLKLLFADDIDVETIMKVFGCNALVARVVLEKLVEEGYLKVKNDKKNNN
mgnify:CR=1 FL=1